MAGGDVEEPFLLPHDVAPLDPEHARSLRKKERPFSPTISKDALDREPMEAAPPHDIGENQVVGEPGLESAGIEVAGDDPKVIGRCVALRAPDQRHAGIVTGKAQLLLAE